MGCFADTTLFRTPDVDAVADALLAAQRRAGLSAHRPRLRLATVGDWTVPVEGLPWARDGEIAFAAGDAIGAEVFSPSVHDSSYWTYRLRRDGQTLADPAENAFWCFPPPAPPPEVAGRWRQLPADDRTALADTLAGAGAAELLTKGGIDAGDDPSAILDLYARAQQENRDFTPAERHAVAADFNPHFAAACARLLPLVEQWLPGLQPGSGGDPIDPRHVLMHELLFDPQRLLQVRTVHLRPLLHAEAEPAALDRLLRGESGGLAEEDFSDLLVLLGLPRNIADRLTHSGDFKPTEPGVAAVAAVVSRPMVDDDA